MRRCCWQRHWLSKETVGCNRCYFGLGPEQGRGQARRSRRRKGFRDSVDPMRIRGLTPEVEGLMAYRIPSSSDSNRLSTTGALASFSTRVVSFFDTFPYLGDVSRFRCFRPCLGLFITVQLWLSGLPFPPRTSDSDLCVSVSHDDHQ